jgi:hypothetical protein
MHRPQWFLVVAALVATLVLAGCSNAPGEGTGVERLPITPSVSTQLLDAATNVNMVPIREYSGLTPGFTYYAFDRSTDTYWAGAKLDPKPSGGPPNLPTRAEVANQDDGAYWLFTQPKGGAWTAYQDGAGGPDTPCPATVPAGVLKAWGWPAGGCRPKDF